MDAHYDGVEMRVLPAFVRAEIGARGVKPMGDHFILDSGTVTAVECLHYAMNLPTSVVITGCDSMEILDQALSAARRFRPMASGDVDALLAKTARAAQRGAYERYKTTQDFDSTVRTPHWLD